MSTVVDIVKGKGRFVDDIILPEMQHLAIVRSNYSRGRILKIEGECYTFKDFPSYITTVGEGATEGELNLREPVLADKYVNYLGQPIAAVLEKDRYKAEDLADSISVDIEPLKPVMDPENSMKSEPIHPSMKSNILSEITIGRDFNAEKYDVRIKDHFDNKRVATNPIETRGIVASYTDGKLTVWIPTQSVHSIREGLSDVLNMPKEKIRVIQTDTGGAFGLKGSVYSEHAIAAFLAIKTGKPVKWLESRRDHLTSSHPGRGTSAEVELFADKTGKIHGIKGKVVVDAGAYSGGSGEFAARFVGMQMCGAYDIPNAYIEAKSILTNKPVQGPYRGAGRPEAHFFIERMVDKLADELHMDPVDVRLLNTSNRELTSPLGVYVPPAKSFLMEAVEKLNYRNLKKDKPGFSIFVLVPAFQPGETARIIVDKNKVRVWLGGNSHGQRHELFVRRIVRENLGIDESLVSLEMGDTDMLEDGIGSWGSRSAMVGGMAVYDACQKIKEAVVKKYGKYSKELLMDDGADVYTHWREKGSMDSLGSNLVTCKVSERGQVTIKECSAYYDVGRPLSESTVRGQIEGGMAQGIGQTLYEELLYNEDGEMLTTSISDAGVPLANQLPDYKVFLADSTSTLATGAKGVGESPTIGVPPALARAIENQTGVHITETPVRQEILLKQRIRTK